MTGLLHHAAGFLAALLFVYASTLPAQATPPATPLNVELKMTEAPSLNESAAVEVTVASSENAPGTLVELVLPAGMTASPRQWTVNLRANTPVRLQSTVTARSAGNTAISARAFRRVSSAQAWSDMASIPLTVAGAATGLSRFGWSVAEVPTATQVAPGNTPVLSTAPTPYVMQADPAEAPGVLPVLRIGAPQQAAEAQPGSPRIATLTGRWSYVNRAGAVVPVNQLLVEVRRADGGALSPRAFCFTNQSGDYSCPFTHPGTDVRTWVRTWTNFDNGTGGQVLGVFDGPDGGGCGSDSIDCTYPIQTGTIACPDGSTCNIGAWQVNLGEPHSGAMWMVSDVANTWIKAIFDTKHGAEIASGPARLDYPAPAGHGTHAHVPPFTGWISIEPPSQQSASITVHEYGHVVQAYWYRDESPTWPTSDCPSPHFIGAVSGPGCALSEGFANFWMWYGTNDPVFRFPGGGSDNLETRNGGTFAAGDQVEGNVAAVMGDMYDFANDGPANNLRDRLSDGITNIWHTTGDDGDNNFFEWWLNYESFHSTCPALEIIRFNSINYTHASCPIFTVTAGVSPSAGGFATGAGTYINGTSITMNAVASGGWVFSRWSQGGATVSTSPSFGLFVNSNRNLVAEFLGLPGNVVLFQPEGSITDRTPIFRWRPAVRATSYHLQVQQNRPGGVMVVDRILTEAALGCADHVTNCRFTLPGANRLALGPYKWRVRGRRTVGPGPFSAFKNISVVAAAPGLAAAD